MIVVTGATGQLGKLVVDGLLEKVPANEVAVAVRNPEKAADLAARGVEVRVADYTDPASLSAAFAGADKVLLSSSSEVGPRLAQHTAAVTAAKENNVGHLVYTSILHADTSKLALAPEHKATEQVIRDSGVPFTLLRNGWYTENYGPTIAQAIEQGSFAGSAGEGALSPATRREYADAAVAVLTTEGHEGAVYELAGDEAWSYSDLAAELTKTAGKPVVYQDIPADQHRELLIGFGVPEVYAGVLVDSDRGIAEGELTNTSGDLSKLIGRPTTSLPDAVAAIVKG